MKTLEAQEQSVLSEYANGDDSAKSLLKKLFPGQDFTLSIMDRVKSYEDACSIKGSTPLTIENFGLFPAEQREYLFAVHKDDVINEVLNEGWSPDWSDEDEYKYYPYFYWDENAAGGSGFSSAGYRYGRSGSGVGSRRTYKTADLAIYAGKQFIDIHRVIHSVRPQIAAQEARATTKAVKSGEVTDRIKSYVDACDEESIKPLTLADFAFLPEEDREAEFASHQIATIARALNGDWRANYGDHSQYKYYPYFFHPAGGSGFSCDGYVFDRSGSGVGSRHVFKTRELAEYAGTQFLDVYRDLMVIE